MKVKKPKTEKQKIKEQEGKDWQKTVLSNDKLAELQIGYHEPSDQSLGYEQRIARAQAEASFKAGINAVVDWINRRRYMCHRSPVDGHYQTVGIDAGEWQAKLKEWARR